MALYRDYYVSDQRQRTAVRVIRLPYGAGRAHIIMMNLIHPLDLTVQGGRCHGGFLVP